MTISFTKPIEVATCAPDQPLIALSNGNCIEIFECLPDSVSWSPRSALNGHKEKIIALSFSPKICASPDERANRLASCDWSMLVVVWSSHGEHYRPQRVLCDSFLDLSSSLFARDTVFFSCNSGKLYVNFHNPTTTGLIACRCEEEEDWWIGRLLTLSGKESQDGEIPHSPPGPTVAAHPVDSTVIAYCASGGVTLYSTYIKKTDGEVSHMAKKFGQFYNATGLTEVGSVEDIRWSGCGSTLFTLSTQGVVAVSEIAGYDVLSKECDSDAGLLGFIGDHNGGTLAFHTRLVQKANEHSVFRRILPSADKTAFIVDYDGDLHQVRDGSTTHMSWDRPKQGRVYDVSRAGADRLAIIRRDEVSVVDYPTSA